MSINIRRDVNDPFYRYKMPPIISKKEGRGNGVKTAVVNLADVARALSRSPVLIVKYFGFELGAQTSSSEDTDRYIVNGIHEAYKLQDSLDGFIAKFVLCGSCKNPETDFIVKGDDVTKDCKACGSKSVVDPRHKLTSFVAKNPDLAVKSKKKGMANAGASTSNATEEAAGEAADDGDDELTRRINAEAANLPSMAGKDEEESWTADVSEEAVRARQKELERTMATLSTSDDIDIKVYNEFGEWIDQSEEKSDVEIFKRAVELGISSKPRTVQVLAQTILTEDIVQDIADHSGLLGKLVASPEHEKALLGGIERLVGLQHPDLVKSVPNILFKLYESELVSEDVVTRWGTKASKRYVDKETSKKVRRAAKPFLDWLEQAESEEEESDDE